jgi:hypothetical protein
MHNFDQHDWNHLHDCVYDITGRDLPQNDLEAIFDDLPDALKTEAHQWGMSDTLWRDNFMQYYRTIKTQMKRYRAKCVILHHNNDFRILMQFEGENSQYICGHRETSKFVTVEKITDNDLHNILCSMEIVLVPERSNIYKVAEKFKNEICSQLNGDICWKDSPNEGFYKIITE